MVEICFVKYVAALKCANVLWYGAFVPTSTVPLSYKNDTKGCTVIPAVSVLNQTEDM